MLRHENINVSLLDSAFLTILHKKRMDMGNRKLRREKEKKKWKIRIRIGILFVLFLIVIYAAFGIYQESKIELREETGVISIEKTKQIEEINTIEKVEISEDYLGFEVIAKLEIPKINLETNILKEYSEEGMKVCASKFWGANPNEIGNFCIAGHNYEQENMFHHLIDLTVGDELYVLDNKNGKYAYTIYDIYKVKPQNTDPIKQDTKGKRVVTLITCVNYSQNRLIVQAIEQ